MGIYVLHTIFGKENNYLTVSKLQTTCSYHNNFKNYKLLNMITPPPQKKKKKKKKWWIWLEPFLFAS